MGIKNWILGSEAKIAAKKYNNQLKTIINDNSQYINAMNDAMMSKDFMKAKAICAVWERQIDERIRKVSAAESFNGNNSLKNAILKGLQTYHKIVSEDYHRLIDIRSGKAFTSIGPNLEEVRLEERLLSNINDAFETAATLVNNARSEFK